MYLHSYTGGYNEEHQGEQEQDLYSGGGGDDGQLGCTFYL